MNNLESKALVHGTWCYMGEYFLFLYWIPLDLFILTFLISFNLTTHFQHLEFEPQITTKREKQVYHQFHHGTVN